MNWKLLCGLVLVSLGCKPSYYLQDRTVQLSAPLFQVDNVFFDTKTEIEILEVPERAYVNFSLNHQAEERYTKPIEITESTKIVAHVAGGNHIPSETRSIELIKVPNQKMNGLTSSRGLDEKYGKGGLDVLFDGEKGGSDFNNGWLGYLGGSVSYELKFETKEVTSVLVSTLNNHGAWIFKPSEVNVYHDNTLIQNHMLDKNVEGASIENTFTKIDLPKITTGSLIVEIVAPKEIPSWHPGNGQKPWVFIDEIFIY